MKAIVVGSIAFFWMFYSGCDTYLDRRYNQVSQIKVHNATSTTQKKILWFIPNIVANQNKSLVQQLTDGMRTFKIPVHPVIQGGSVVPWATHTVQTREIPAYVAQAIGYIPSFIRPLFAGRFQTYVNTILIKNLWKIDLANQPLIDVLGQLKQFLDTHDDQIVTLFLNIFDIDQMAKELIAIFAASGIDRYMHAQDIGKEWPTMRELIASNKRLIVFVDIRSNVPGFHALNDYVYGNNYAFSTIEQLNDDTGSSALANPAWQRKMHCIQNPGDTSIVDNTLFDMNHAVTPGIAGDAQKAAAMNTYNFVMGHIQRCSATLSVSGKTIVPNYIGVDFYDQSIDDLKQVVAQLNR